MFLFYYQGSLVDAGNDVRSKEVRGRAGQRHSHFISGPTAAGALGTVQEGAFAGLP
jgi:hypothetical protein